MDLEQIREEMRQSGKSERWIKFIDTATDNEIAAIKETLHGEDRSARLQQKMLIAKLLQETFDA